MSAHRLSLILILSAAFVLTSGRLFGQPCQNTEMTRLPSPDGARDLLTFVRRCGADYSSEVALVPKGQPLPDGPGNVGLPGHPKKLVARWSAADTVIIASPAAGPSPYQTRVEGVTIVYVRP